jgi:hypothetical protein
VGVLGCGGWVIVAGGFRPFDFFLFLFLYGVVWCRLNDTLVAFLRRVGTRVVCLLLL